MGGSGEYESFGAVEGIGPEATVDENDAPSFRLRSRDQLL